MTTPMQDVDDLVAQLTDGCQAAGLEAVVLAPTRVRVSSPRTDARLTEIIRCMPDHQEALYWWWSWNEPICPAAQITDAVKVIAHMVMPPEPEGSPEDLSE
jgi:hypothetical protein